MPAPTDTPAIERRFIPTAIELRAVEGEGEMPRIAGYAAVFNELSEDLGGFREKIAPGAFTKAIGGDVRALFNHDPNFVLGRSKSRTLTMSEDQRGLAIEITPPDTSQARSILEAMRRGDVDGMSFGFRTVKDKWELAEGEAIRTLLDVEVFDVSVVTFPAYPQAGAALRSLEEFRKGHPPIPEDDMDPDDGLAARMRMKALLAGF